MLYKMDILLEMCEQIQIQIQIQLFEIIRGSHRSNITPISWLQGINFEWKWPLKGTLTVAPFAIFIWSNYVTSELCWHSIINI
jgi:hypothetical protein